MSDRHRDLAEFDQAVAEHEARQLADELGYAFGVLTDGTIVLEPPAALIPPIAAPLDGFIQLGHVSEDRAPAIRWPRICPR